MGAENHAESRAAIHDPDTVRAMLEDYRAGLGVDRGHDEADRRRGPHASVSDPAALGEPRRHRRAVRRPAAIWRRLGGRPARRADRSGHHMAEENPAALAAALIDFLG